MSIKIRERRDGKAVRLQAIIYAIPPGKLKAERFRYNAPASITSKSGAERWAAQVRRDIEAGRPPPQSREARVKAAAEEVQQHQVAELERRASMTIAEWCVAWEESERAARVRETTLETRRKALARMCQAVGSRPVAQFCELDVVKVRRAMSGLKATTANVYLGVCKQALEAARAAGLRREPVGKLRIKNAEPIAERPHVEEDEGEDLIAVAATLGRQHLAVLLLGLDAGLRSGEMAGLQVGDVDGPDLHVRRSIAVVKGERCVFAPKSGSSRTLPLSPRLAAVLAELADDSADGWLFHQENGAPAVRRQIETWLRHVVRKAGARPISPHALRHGFASQLLRAGVDPETVRRLMGHATLTTTAKYSHSTDASRRGAVTRLLAHRGAGTDLTRAEGASSARHGERGQVREITGELTRGRARG